MNYWVIIPAAGAGKRLGAVVPKQYLTLNNKTVLEHTISRFQAISAIKGIVVCIDPDDVHFKSLDISKQVMSTAGGKERCNSVLNGLHFLAQWAEEEDWILVHDAARPCVRTTDIEKLMMTLKENPIGGLLAVPVRDTLKLANSAQTIISTQNRENLWHALTPQMFRFKLLKEALERAICQKQIVTDESQAIEQLGLKPSLIEGHADNIKITYLNDITLATVFLQNLN
ncbi:MAG: hypothetical protein RIT27_76 [Pseudomonadota bacterium]|jgi:2-C-methyl-D-erythritol 4-phosphate cytidylyltransferase